MWTRRRRAPRLREELEFHRERLIADYLASGMDLSAAKRRAFVEFGNVAALEESSRDVRGRFIGDFLHDMQYAVRTMRRAPGFALAAGLSLGLAIGANTAIFSLVNGVLLRALPVRDPDALVQITRLTPDGRPANVSYPLFERFRADIPSISGALAHGTAAVSIALDGEQEFLSAELVSGDYFSVLGIAPGEGRLLDPSDDSVAPGAPAAVITDGYWRRRFGRDPRAIGRTFALRDRVFTIVGVTPPAYRSVRVGTAPDVVLPLLTMISAGQRTTPTNNFLKVLGRLKPGATAAQATAEAAVSWRRFIEPLAAALPGGLRAEVLERRVAALPAADGLNPFRDELSEPLLVLMGSVGVVLLLACVNVAGLLMARTAARERELGIRLAIGAGRGRLIRQLLTESVALAAIGGGVGLLVAAPLSRRLVTLFVNGRELDLSVGPDGLVLAFTAATALASSLVAGLLPAVLATRRPPHPALKQPRAHGTGRLGRTLVTAQVAISMLLVVGATLFVGTLVRLHRIQPGFDSRDVLVVELRSTGSTPVGQRVAAVTGLVERLQALPGVERASVAQVVPISGNDWTRPIELPAEAERPGESETAFNVIGPSYFATLRTPVVAGREFDRRDRSGAEPVAVVNERFARDFFGDRSPLGRHVTSLGVRHEIVGVVGDAMYEDLRQGFRRTMYVPWTMRPEDAPQSYKLLVRTDGHSSALPRARLERLVREVSPDLRVRAMEPYATILDRSMPAERILATLGGLFGGLALSMAAIGLFALLAFQTRRRTNELGVRFVLGATRRSVIGLVARDVAWMLVPGLVIGGGAAWLLSGLARGLLSGMAPGDPVTFGFSAAALGMAAVVAAWLPAMRAARIDPLDALRQE